MGAPPLLYTERDAMTESEKIPLSASGVRYLLALRELDRDGRGVRCAELAQSLGLSRPSVHNMMDSFAGLGLVNKNAYGVVLLTEEGRLLAKRCERWADSVTVMLRDAFPNAPDVRNAASMLLAEMTEADLDALCSRVESSPEGKERKNNHGKGYAEN